MGIMVYSLLWVMQTLYHQQYVGSFPFLGSLILVSSFFIRVPYYMGDLTLNPKTLSPKPLNP